MDDLAAEIDRTATDLHFSGVVQIERGDGTTFAAAYGSADRNHGVANTVATRFGLASGAKGFTALTVAALVDEGVLSFTTTTRSLLGRDLPLIDDAVTVEHLLAHRSGIGDYLDEETGLDVEAYALPVGAHELVTTERYVAVLDGYPPKFTPGTRFAYCNSGYVLLALLAERATGTSFYELVDDRVCTPAGLRDTAFLRADECRGGTATGYLDVGTDRTNVFHLPLRGSGDGGIFSTAGDIGRLWRSLFAGEIIPPALVGTMVRPQNGVGPGSTRYGLGFWVERDDSVALEGMDAGVSFRSVHDRRRRLTYTVISNSTRGAWPLCRLLQDRLGAG